MGTDETNIVAFQPRPVAVPAVRDIRLRLLGDHCDIQATLFDDNDDVIAVIEYAIVAKPAEFDLQRLIAAWHEWSDRSNVVA